MKYSIQINQLAIVANKWAIELEDAAIFDMLKDFANSPKVKKMIEGEKVYFWFSWKLVVEQLPIIKRNSRSTILSRFSNLVNAGLLEPNPNNQTLAQSWFAFGKNYSKMIFCEIQPIQKTEHPLCEKQTPCSENNIVGVLKTEHPLSEKLNTTKENINTKENKGLNSEVSTSLTHTQHLGNPLELPKEETVTEDNHLDSKISVNEIDRTTTPENCNAGNFLLLRQFAKLRAAKKGKRDVFTLRAWNMMCKAFAEYSKQYDARVLEAHLNEALTKPNWTSPFGASWIGDALERLAKAMNLTKPTLANNAQVEESPQEPPFIDAQKEATYQLKIKQVLQLVPALPNSKVRNLNRAEYWDIFEKQPFAQGGNPTKNAIWLGKRGISPNFLSKVRTETLQKLSGDSFLFKKEDSIYNILCVAINEALRKKAAEYGD